MATRIQCDLCSQLLDPNASFLFMQAKKGTVDSINQTYDKVFSVEHICANCVDKGLTITKDLMGAPVLQVKE